MDIMDKEIFHHVNLKGEIFDELCTKLLIALSNTPDNSLLDELHDLYGGKNIYEAFKYLKEHGYFINKRVSAQLSIDNGCFIVSTDSAFLTPKAINRINSSL